MVRDAGYLLSTKNLVFVYIIVMIIGFYWMLKTEPNCITHNHRRNPLDEYEEYSRQKLEAMHQDLNNRENKLLTMEQRLTKIMRKLQRTHPSELINAILKQLEPDIPIIYAITPTYARPVQKAELTRLAQTFINIHNFHWILIEDSDHKTDLVTNFLMTCGVRHSHLNVVTPPDYKLDQEDPNWLKPRGVLQRNLGLEWLRTNLNKQETGVLYFADDDNTYDISIFDEIRTTKTVSVWPVGLVGGLMYESPIVKDGKVTGWHTYWKPDRPFAMDMAGFAVNIRLVLSYPEVVFANNVPRGYQESVFLKPLVTMDQLEPKAHNCTKILVWHTRTEKPKLKNESKMKKIGKMSDPNIEV